MSSQDPSDRTGRNTYSELSKLALDPDASPAPVLPTETNDDLDQFVAHWRSARASLFSPPPPLVRGCFSMPSQHGVGGDQEGSPPGPR
jgi:hypothetical protein